MIYKILTFAMHIINALQNADRKVSNKIQIILLNASMRIDLKQIEIRERGIFFCIRCDIDEVEKQGGLCKYCKN